jgi:hypothetical protein
MNNFINITSIPIGMISLEQILSRTEIGKIKVLSYNGILEKEPEEMMYDFAHSKDQKPFLEKIKPVEITLYRNNYFNIIIAETTEENFNPIKLIDQNHQNVNPDEFNLNNKYELINFYIKREDFENVIITEKNSRYVIDNDETVVEYTWDFKNNILNIKYIVFNNDKTNDKIQIKLKKENIDDNTSLVIDETIISLFREGVNLEATYVDGNLCEIEGYYNAASLAFENQSKYLDLITKTHQNETTNPGVGTMKNFANTPLSSKFLKYVLKDQTGICESFDFYKLLDNIKENKNKNLKDMLISLT